MATEQLVDPQARLTRCIQPPGFSTAAGPLMAIDTTPDWLRVGTSIEIAAPPQRVFNCLRNLGCLCRWWPRARALYPEPPGLCDVGDMAVLQLSDGPALLKVLCFQPGRRIVLSLRQPGQALLLDLGVTGGEAHSRIRLQLEIERCTGAIASARQAFWLSLLSRRAAGGLRRHLRWELGQGSSL